MRVRNGRAVLFCKDCAQPVATVSEAAIQRVATFTPWRGRTTEQLLKMVTDNAAVICTDCEQVAIAGESARD